MAIGYKFPYRGTATDIADIAVPGYGNTPDPCVYFGEAGFRTDNKTGPNNNKFLAVNSYDPWKTGIGVINYYSSNKTGVFGLTNDIASIYSCPNFKKVVGFYGDGTQPDPTARKVFERNKTYRLQVKIWESGFLISIGENATNGVSPSNVGQWYLESKTGTLPTALIVGIQAAGGNGGKGAVISGGGYTFSSGGAGGGAGACCFVVLDWITAAKKVTYGRTGYVLFDFYITPIDNWKKIAYPDDTSTTKCDCDCVTINLKDNFYGSSNKEAIKSKIIIGCGQSIGRASNGHETIPGKAGIIKNYDLGDSVFGIETGKVYENSELSEYGIHILNMYPVGKVTENAGNGGNSSSTAETGAGYNSIHYWLVPTNCDVDENQYAHMTPGKYLVQLYEKEGGTANSYQYGGTGGGGASNYAKGGNGGKTDPYNSSNGDDGTLGSGGGGGFNNNGAGGKGGLPYIFFCSNIDFSITDLS